MGIRAPMIETVKDASLNAVVHRLSGEISVGEIVEAMACTSREEGICAVIWDFEHAYLTKSARHSQAGVGGAMSSREP